MPDQSSLTATDLPDKHEREWVREATTMALYVSVSLLAVLLVQPSRTTEDNLGLAMIVFLPAVGLLLAHQFAYRVSTRLVSQGVLDPESLQVLGAQMLGGGIVAVMSALPPLLLGPVGFDISVCLLLALVSVVGYRAARSVPTSRVRSLLYVASLVAVVLGIVIVKALSGH